METIETLKSISSKVFDGGKIIYSEDGNPYETVEVYVLLENGLLLGHYISEHSYDGTSSWKLINLNEDNLEKLKQVIAEKNSSLSVEDFLKQEFYATEACTNKFVEFLKKNEIVHENNYYF